MAKSRTPRCICGEAEPYWLTETVGICRTYGLWIGRYQGKLVSPVPPEDKRPAVKVLFERLEGERA